ncbi:MAG: hypothetical protein CMB82_03790 [Flammeovirgaceae bacterium]|nr:hypothetical protein [Flammeovirgaceae bacterium]|tara:strand:- start:1573 stop:2076 length:504 start_codon:yes stop_codon:yes gene_type:complete
MKKITLLSIILFAFSCSTISEREKRINSMEEIALKAYNAQMTGDIETFKLLISEDFTYTLNGELDISQTYAWDEYMKFAAYFGSLLKGEVGAEFGEIIAGENAAIVFTNGKMEGIGGKYENEYALKYTVNSEGKISNIKEWLSDILLATQLYGQQIEGVHIDPEKRF